MGRMHAPGKGLSQSALPYRRSVPTWLKLTSDDVKEQIYKLAKKGLTPSQIGGCDPERLPWCCTSTFCDRQ
uniref:Small ribosomal subunit protein uS15 N-terminal domain-containing protein n=1 Tax=Canis lupus dingo TaxID=286419 RepID=A0A8C0KY11_CANLU